MANTPPNVITISATAQRAIPPPDAPRLAAVKAIADYLRMLRAWTEKRFAVAGNGSGITIIPNRLSHTYARLGADTGPLIEARIINVLDPEEGDSLLVRRENPGGPGGWIVLDWFGLGVVPIRSCEGCYPPPSGLIGWWTGDTTAEDLMGNYNGTLQNGATYATGMVEQAFSLTRAGDDHILIGTTPNLSASLTLDAWVYPFSVPEADTEVPAETWSQPYAIITKWAQNTATDCYGMWLHSPDGLEIRLLGGIGHSGPDAGFTGFGTLNVNEWSFVAMTYNAATDDNYLYVNGVQVAHRVQPGGVNTSGVTNVMIGREDSPLPRNFDGLIDEVEVFTRALTPEEILGIYAAGSFGKCKDFGGGGGPQ